VQTEAEVGGTGRAYCRSTTWMFGALSNDKPPDIEAASRGSSTPHRGRLSYTVRRWMKDFRRAFCASFAKH
jgi:hypothetical protein